jgi:tRNA/tmRNA/rRNA uracil-C5-methylase (TrmA/RlmC/RlmD family)
MPVGVRLIQFASKAAAKARIEGAQKAMERLADETRRQFAEREAQLAAKQDAVEQAIKRLGGPDLAASIWDCIEDKVAAR